jgi:dTDP-4-dehydrorhamnose reductase
VSSARRLPRRIFVAGHRGMLGHVVARAFAEQGVEVATSDARYGGGPSDPLVEAARESGAEAVVNCLGLIKHKSGDPLRLSLANALFPLHLVQRLHPEQHLLHASTDCVFAGTRGGYRLDDERDATDDYGRSKILGEGVARWPNATVIRVSIVGPSDASADPRGRGLLGWLLAQPAGARLPGFTNHLWNGITTLEWAQIALELLARRAAGETLPAIVQPASDTVDKCTLLRLFAAAFETGHEIRATEAAEAVDRTLVPTMRRAPLAAQVEELAAWYGAGSPLPVG